MDLRYLEYVVTLADEQNMSKAASLLHISQPTLSIYIKNLEAELGLALFARTHNRMSLTPAGEAYVSCCRQILEMRKELYLTLESMKKWCVDRAKLQKELTGAEEEAICRYLEGISRDGQIEDKTLTTIVTIYWNVKDR